MIEFDSFEEGGFARLSHFDSLVWRTNMDKLEQMSATFATAWREGGQGYPWPLDPLHWWSRIWEYPFFSAHLDRIRDSAPAGDRLRLLDIGAAVTFFTPYILSRGFEVLNMDYDARMPFYFERAWNDAFPGNLGNRPPYLVADARNNLLPTASFDVITSVSVLEHIPEWERALMEMLRVLRPNGHLILTFDVRLNEQSQGFNILEVQKLLDLVSEYATIITSTNVNLPTDVLDMHNSPMAKYKQPKHKSLVRSLWPPHLIPKKATRKLVKKFSLQQSQENMAIFAAVWTKM